MDKNIGCDNICTLIVTVLKLSGFQKVSVFKIILFIPNKGFVNYICLKIAKRS